MARFGLTAPTGPTTRPLLYNGMNGNAQPGGPFGLSAKGLGRAILALDGAGGISYTRANPAPTTPTIAASLLPAGRYGLKTPRFLKVGSQLRCYADTYDATFSNWQVGLLTTSDLTGATGWSWAGFLGLAAEAADQFPVIIEDAADPDTQQRFKLWIGHGYGGAGGHRIQYAHSPTGLPGTFTLYGDVLRATESWEWLAGQPGPLVLPAAVVIVDREIIFWYSTRYAGSAGTPDYYWHSGRVKVTNPKSNYDTQGKVQLLELENDSYFSKSSSMSAVTAGASSFTAGTPSNIDVGWPYYLGESTWLFEYLRIGSKVGSLIGLEAGTTFAMSHSAGVAYHGMRLSTIIDDVWYDPQTDRVMATATTFESAAAYEDGVLMQSAAGAGFEDALAYVPSKSPILPRVPTTQWDGISAENPCVLIESADPLWSRVYVTPADVPVGRSWDLPYRNLGLSTVGRSWGLPYANLGPEATSWPTRRTLVAGIEPTSWPTRRTLTPGHVDYPTRRTLERPPGLFDTRRTLVPTYTTRGGSAPVLAEFCGRGGTAPVVQTSGGTAPSIPAYAGAGATAPVVPSHGGPSSAPIPPTTPLA